MNKQKRTIFTYLFLLIFVLLAFAYFTFNSIIYINAVGNASVSEGGGKIEAQKLWAQYYFNASAGAMVLVGLVISVFVSVYANLDKKLNFGNAKVNKIQKWIKNKFTPRRIGTAVLFSAVAGVNYWAWTLYEKAFNSDKWWMGLLAFILVAAVLLICGSTLLDAMYEDK